MSEVRLGMVDFLDIACEIMSGNRTLRFRAHGYSMFPIIRDGDIMNVSPNQSNTLKVGDVVLFQRASSQLVAHRIIRFISDDCLLIQGDSQYPTSERIHMKRILGKVESIERRGRRIQVSNLFWRQLGLFWSMISPIRRKIRSSCNF